MNLLRSNAFKSAGVAAAALLFVLAAPRAAHGASASLVHAANGIGMPLIGLGAPPPNAKIVTLTAEGAPGGALENLHLLLSGGTKDFANYAVPAGQNLVVTSVEISPFQSGPTYSPAHVLLEGTGNPGYSYWLVSNQITTQFNFPSGFLIESGITPTVYAEMYCFVTVHGYLVPA